MLELFFESSGTVHMEFIPRRSDCKQVPLRGGHCHLPKPNCPKSPKLWCRKNCLLLYNNAPAHRSVVVHEELAKQQVSVLPHPPYSPELAKTPPSTVKLLCAYMAVGDWSLTYLRNRCLCNSSLISRFWLLVINAITLSLRLLVLRNLHVCHHIPLPPLREGIHYVYDQPNEWRHNAMLTPTLVLPISTMSSCSTYPSLNILIVMCKPFVSRDVSRYLAQPVTRLLILRTPLPTLDTPVLNLVRSEI
jgi:hypothetical protein